MASCSTVQEISRNTQEDDENENNNNNNNSTCSGEEEEERKIYQCIQCDNENKLFTRNGIKNHYAWKHPKCESECKVCFNSFDCPSSLSQHFNTTHAKKQLHKKVGKSRRHRRPAK